MKRVYLLLLYFLMFGVSLFAQDIKNPDFAGAFYPRDQKTLSARIKEYLMKAPAYKPKGKVLGIISPHAGYIYSASVAAYGYKSISNEKAETLLILCPSHHYSFRGVSVYPRGAFKTPLGVLPVNENLTQRMKALSFVQFKQEYFAGEHSCEVQLPFIQSALGPKKIVPIVFGRMTFGEMKEFALFLKELSRTENFLVVVSTDLSHYHPYETAKNIDERTIKYIKQGDAAGLYSALDEGRACGILPLITFLLYVEQQGGTIEILHYANSGDTAGDKKAVVGYVSAIGYVRAVSEKEDTMGLTLDDKKSLLTIARETLEYKLNNKKVPQVSAASDVLNEKRAVFVTLKKKGQLRGCIGRIVADTPLYKAVSKVAVDSALRDPRFNEVQSSELADIEIEISVMTPFTQVTDLGEIEVGVHGLMIQRGFNSGILLPQVPVEWGWDRTTYLEQLCRKAGLPSDAYKDEDTVIYKFSAEVFSESDMK